MWDIKQKVTNKINSYIQTDIYQRKKDGGKTKRIKRVKYVTIEGVQNLNGEYTIEYTTVICLYN